jgi:hypothetical protein
VRRIRKQSGGLSSRRSDALCEPQDREAKLPGQRLSARDFDRQVAKFQVRVAILNGFTALGTPVTEVAAQIYPGKGALRSSADLCDRVERAGASGRDRWFSEAFGWRMGWACGLTFSDN